MVYRILATIFVFLAGGSLFGAYFYATGMGDHKQASRFIRSVWSSCPQKPTGSFRGNGAIAFDSSLPRSEELARLIRSRAGVPPA